MKIKLSETAAITRSLKLKAPESYLNALRENPAAVTLICHDADCKHRLMPDFIYGLDIIPAVLIHIWMYTFPEKFSSAIDCLMYKKLADDWLEANVNTLIDSSGHPALRFLRRIRLAWHRHRLRKYGDAVFLRGKPQPPDYPQYYKQDT